MRLHSCDVRRVVTRLGEAAIAGLWSSSGFMAEADSLLTVSAGASLDRMRNAPTARALLQTLHSETSIFSSREPPPERYLFILVRVGVAIRSNAFQRDVRASLTRFASSPSQDRLLYLDIADDFLAKAKRFYPPKDDSDEEPTGLAINLPLLLARVEASMNGGGREDEEESEREDGNLSDKA